METKLNNRRLDPSSTILQPPGMAGGILPSWNSPPSGLTLHPHEVHIWVAEPVNELLKDPDLERVLSRDERDRASRFRNRSDRESFIGTRGLLRVILGGYVGKDPKEIIFQYGTYGKPLLAVPGAGCLSFNLSHSGGTTLLAVSTGEPIGIDVEKIRSDVDMVELWDRFFSPREAEELRSLPGNLTRDAFFSCWTRKEAFLKATGRGLSLPLNRFEVSVLPHIPPRIKEIEGSRIEALRWALRDVYVGPGFAASMAVRKSKVKLTLFP